MSEKEKKNAPQEEQPQANTTPETEQAAEKAAEEETFTVTREQMEQMEQLAKMVSDASDKYLRLAAEYDNYRKRTTKEKENTYADAKADTVKEFLGVLDGALTEPEAIELVKLRSRQYAKRQLTWLRRNPAIHWIFWEKDRDFARALQISTEILSASGLG